MSEIIEYSKLEERRQVALKNNWKDVINSLEKTEDSWPDAQDLFDLVGKSYDQKRFSMAANALKDTGHLEVFNPDIKQKKHRFKAFGYENGYWEDTRNSIRAMLRENGEEQYI